MHSDPGFLTILQDDELVNGLEVVNQYTGELVSVNPVPGTLVVNIGDVAKIIYQNYSIFAPIECHFKRFRFNPFI